MTEAKALFFHPHLDTIISTDQLFDQTLPYRAADKMTNPLHFLLSCNIHLETNIKNHNFTSDQRCLSAIYIFYYIETHQVFSRVCVLPLLCSLVECILRARIHETSAFSPYIFFARQTQTQFQCTVDIVDTKYSLKLSESCCHPRLKVD